MYRSLIVLLVCVSITMAAVTPLANQDIFTSRSVGRSLAKCLGEPQIFMCLQKEALQSLDIILRDNSTWKYSDFVQFEKDQNFTFLNQMVTRRSEDTFGQAISEKLVQLAQARSIRLTVNPKALEGEMRALSTQNEGGDNTRKYQKIWYLNDSLKGRKKKDKDKGTAMLGGMAMVAMMAQMFLGKVMLIAGSAFVMAKIALMVSLLTSLKTKPSGGGSTTDHVVTYTDAGGGGGHSGWHRSLPTHAHTIANHYEPSDEDHHSTSQIPDYYQYDRNTQKDYQFI